MEKLKDSIVPASIGKRAGAFVLDCLFVFACYLLTLYTLGTGVLSDSFGAKQDTVDYFAYATDSKLFEYTNEDKNAIQLVGTNFEKEQSSLGVSTPKTYEVYYSSLEYLYSEFLPNDARISDEESYGKEYFFTKVLGLPSYDMVSSLTAEEIRNNASSLCGTSEFYQYKVTEDGVVPASVNDASASLQDKYQSILNNGDETAVNELVTKLNTYFYGDNASPIYAANNVLAKQAYYKNLSQHSMMANWEIRLICFLPYSFIFFFLIPGVTSNGQTLGKLICRTCLVGQDGYKVKTMNKLARAAIMFVLGSIYVIAPLNNMYLIFGAVTVYLIDYIIMAASKDGYFRALQDRLTKTLVIDKKKSEFFLNAQQEEEHLMVIEPKEESAAPTEEYFDMESIKKAREEARGVEHEKKD